jgi:hypothetical protein
MHTIPKGIPKVCERVPADEAVARGRPPARLAVLQPVSPTPELTINCAAQAVRRPRVVVTRRPGGRMTMNDDLPRPVRTLVDAANAGDTAAFLAAFTPDGVVDDWGREFRGPDDIQGWSDGEFIGVEVSLEVEEVELDGPRTIVAAIVGGNGFNGPSTFTFTTVGGLVSRMMIRG